MQRYLRVSPASLGLVLLLLTPSSGVWKETDEASGPLESAYADSGDRLSDAFGEDRSVGRRPNTTELAPPGVALQSDGAVRRAAQARQATRRGAAAAWEKEAAASASTFFSGIFDQIVEGALWCGKYVNYFDIVGFIMVLFALRKHFQHESGSKQANRSAYNEAMAGRSKKATSEAGGMSGYVANTVMYMFLLALLIHEASVQLADHLHSDGKIHVVYGVIYQPVLRALLMLLVLLKLNKMGGAANYVLIAFLGQCTLLDLAAEPMLYHICEVEHNKSFERSDVHLYSAVNEYYSSWWKHKFCWWMTALFCVLCYNVTHHPKVSDGASHKMGFLGNLSDQPAMYVIVFFIFALFYFLQVYIDFLMVYEAILWFSGNAKADYLCVVCVNGLCDNHLG